MVYVVGIEVEKIQSYIFQRFDDLKSSSQHDNKELLTIMESSKRVSQDIMGEIKTKYMVKKDDIIMESSGKIIFITKLSEKESRCRFNELFKSTYKEYDGNIFLNYAFKKSSYLEKIKFIKDISKGFKSNESKSIVIKENKDLLFNFTELDEKEIIGSSSNKSKIFAKNLDALVTENIKNENKSTDGKIAIVKADLDGLGKTFENINTYKCYTRFSELLKKEINMENFEKKIESVKYLKGKIFPFYIAGDDLFYAVTIDGLLDSIKIIKNIITDINKETKEMSEIKKISVSIGAIFTNNHMPLRYYRDMVEKELLSAKKMMVEKNMMKEKASNNKSKNELNAILGVSISGNNFFVYNGEKGKGQSDGLSKFIDEINELNWIRNECIELGSHLNNMLLAIESENSNNKKLNMALYYLLPNMQNSNKSQLENLVKYYFLSKIVEDKHRNKKNRKERLFDCRKVSEILIPRLKLILILTDSRYIDIVKKPSSERLFGGEYKKQFYKKFKSTMFNKPINHLIEKNKLSNYINLFIEKENKKINNGKKTIQIYKTVDCSASTFIRAKKLVEQNKKELLVNLFINSIQKNDKDNSEKTEINYTIDLRVEEFKKIIKECSNYDWLDILILIYKYNDERIKFKQYKSYEEYFKVTI